MIASCGAHPSRYSCGYRHVVTRAVVLGLGRNEPMTLRAAERTLGRPLVLEAVIGRESGHRMRVLSHTLPPDAQVVWDEIRGAAVVCEDESWAETGHYRKIRPIVDSEPHVRPGDTAVMPCPDGSELRVVAVLMPPEPNSEELPMLWWAEELAADREDGAL